MDRSTRFLVESTGMHPVRFVCSYTAVIDGTTTEDFVPRTEPKARQSFVSGDLADPGDHGQIDIRMQIHQY
jgi:hypothetical protein